MQVMAKSQEHPTANQIYELVKEVVPGVSLGTIYRNLNVLVKEGLLQRVACENGADRYDRQLKPHAHFLCECCGALMDLSVDLIGLRRCIRYDSLSRIDSFALTIRGRCKACMISRS